MKKKLWLPLGIWENITSKFNFPLEEGDVLICIDPKDEHYLQIGYVNLIDIEGFETNVAYVEYQDKSTVKYEVWRMEGCFRRFITEGLRI